MNAPLQRHDLPPQQLDVHSDGLRLRSYIWDRADAPTLLLVHGYPDNHEVWLPLIRELANDYRIVAYDVRGCGASQVPRRVQDYRLPQLLRHEGIMLFSPELEVLVVGALPPS